MKAGSFLVTNFICLFVVVVMGLVAEPAFAEGAEIKTKSVFAFSVVLLQTLKQLAVADNLYVAQLLTSRPVTFKGFRTFHCVHDLFHSTLMFQVYFQRYGPYLTNQVLQAILEISNLPISAKLDGN